MVVNSPALRKLNDVQLHSLHEGLGRRTVGKGFQEQIGLVIWRFLGQAELYFSNNALEEMFIHKYTIQHHILKLIVFLIEVISDFHNGDVIQFL